MNDSLKQIAKEIENCLRCGLCQSRTNAVAGEGNINAKIMIIGEAPGKTEDSQGKPFVGMAGKVLRNSLEKSGIDPRDIFITNIVKCRPPGNRVPRDEEKRACVGYLERQIYLIAPKIICVLGNSAYSFLLNGKSVLTDHGKIKIKNNIRYFITIHPAATLYNKQLKEIFENDILKLAVEKDKINERQTSLFEYKENGK